MSLPSRTGDARPRTSLTSAKAGFRSDIQGLRAFAVIAVILGHLVHWPVGGFVGVDIFFVISGFLITGLLLREYGRTETISFLSFYKRRVKRILPAAMLVILLTVGVGYVVFNGARAKSTLWDGIWASVFGANWNLAVAGTDYFQNNGPASPLQHYWSLSVEEQFYFVWPWLLLGVLLLRNRTGRRTIAHTTAFWTIGALSVLSFAWALHETTTNPTVAYFSTLSRAWELGVGALLACAVPVLERIRDSFRPAIAWLGLTGMMLSIVLVTEGPLFPAPAAALPVFSVAAVIAAGTGGQQRFLWLLTNRLSTYLGNMSYSLYLWHFPVIIFAAEFIPEGIGYYATSAMLILFFALFAYHLVEDPLRKVSWKRPKQGWGSINLPGAYNATFGVFCIIVTVAMFAVVLAPMPEPAPAQAPVAAAQTPAPAAPAVPPAVASVNAQVRQALSATGWPELTPTVDEAPNDRGLLATECHNPKTIADDGTCTFGDGELKALVIGDSFASATLAAVRDALTPQGYTVRGISFGSCAITTANAVNETAQESANTCNRSKPEVVNFANTWGADVVIIIDSEVSYRLFDATGYSLRQDAWTATRTKALQQFAAPDRRVVVLETNPRGKVLTDCAKRASVPADCVGAVDNVWSEKVAGDKAAAAAAGAEYVATLPLYCERGLCPAFAGSAPQLQDGDHLTPAYDALIAPAFRELLVAAH